jgi:hypothetical protein
MKSLVAAFAFALAAPGLAHAATADIVSRDVPLRATAGPTVAATVAPPRFNLVGLHWQGGGSVEFRTRSLAGRWSVWRPAAPEDEDRPDRSARERTRAGWQLGNPYWTGASDRLEVRTRGLVRRVRAHYVWSPVASPTGEAPQRMPALVSTPAILPRSGWRASESIRRGAPQVARSLRFAVVHHTAGSNSYTQAQAPAVVRAIQLYHVRGNGWNDIGYNFLVDKYGQVFEGRFGGIERNVVGAHAEGFNTGSTGVALIGNYNGTGITPAARAALVRLLAWRLDIAHVDPLKTFNAISGGNARFARGVPVFLRTIVGHRDTGFTDCPGSRLYAALDGLARDVSRTGLPKIYEPVVRGTLGGPVRFTARLSGPVAWRVTVVNGGGTPVAAGSGTGTTVDWTWDATAAAPGNYSYTFDATGARPATGTLGRAGTLSLRNLRATPRAVTPNGDGRDDTATISYELGAPATVTATLVSPTGAVLSTLFSEPRSAGPQSFVFAAEGVPDGNYRITLVAVGADGRRVTGSVEILVNRTLSNFRAERAAISPNGDGRLETIDFTFVLAVAAEVRLRILRRGVWVATPALQLLEPGAHRLSWNGKKRVGRALQGSYEAELAVTDIVGTVSQRVPFVLDTTPPRLRLLSLRPLRLWVSEPAEIVLRVNNVRRVVRRTRAGRFAVGFPFRPRTVRATAWDAAGNRSRPLRFP